MNEEKIKCTCGKIATWLYMPNTDNLNSPFYCDNCVSRGCNCNWRSIEEPALYGTSENKLMPQGIEGVNWKWVDQNMATAQGIKQPIPEKKYWTFLDINKKEFPCCEYEYEESGYNINEQN